jgi:hypothetical protein
VFAPPTLSEACTASRNVQVAGHDVLAGALNAASVVELTVKVAALAIAVEPNKQAAPVVNKTNQRPR